MTWGFSFKALSLIQGVPSQIKNISEHQTLYNAGIINQKKG
jgi:hypothetical protein